MKNWKTTLCGLAAAAGLAMQASPNPTVALIGKFLAATGAIIYCRKPRFEAFFVSDRKI